MYIYIYIHIYMCIYVNIYTHIGLSPPRMPVTTIVWCLHQQQERQLWRKQTSTGHGPTVVQTHPTNFHWENPAFVVWPETQLERKNLPTDFCCGKKKQRVLRSFNVQKTSSYNRQSKKFTKGLAELSPCICFYI